MTVGHVISGVLPAIGQPYRRGFALACVPPFARTFRTSRRKIAVHKPLDHTKRETRFMRMLGVRDSALAFELRKFSLNDQPEYVALSHAWGDELPTHTIRLNGTKTLVRSNLYAYLELMHKEQNKDWIFIDALCVNQSNDAEKESQVALMGHIYQNAVEVIAWLGYEGPIGEQIRNESNQIQWQGLLDDGLGLDALIEKSWREKRNILVPLIEAFCSHRYWSRVWIVQETILAKRLIFRSGGLCWRSEALLPLLRQIFKYSFSDLNLKTDQNLLGMIQAQIRGGRLDAFREGLYFAGQTLLVREMKLTKMTLDNAVVTLARRKCSIVQDRIYGLLGLSWTTLRPDYNLSPLRLYITVLVECLLENEHRPIKYSMQDFAMLQICLLEALGLTPFHPTVAVVTSEVFKGSQFAPSQARAEHVFARNFMYRLIPYSLPVDKGFVPWYIHIPARIGAYCFAIYERLLTWLWLSYYGIRPHATLPSCVCDSTRLHLGAWMRTVEDISIGRARDWNERSFVAP